MQQAPSASDDENAATGPPVPKFAPNTSRSSREPRETSILSLFHCSVAWQERFANPSPRSAPTNAVIPLLDVSWKEPLPWSQTASCMAAPARADVIRVASSLGVASSNPALSSCGHNFPQCREHPLHFLHRVVVDQADAEEAASAFHAELFGDVQSVIITVPGEKGALAEFCCELRRSEAVDAHNHRRAAMIKLLRVADAV